MISKPISIKIGCLKRPWLCGIYEAWLWGNRDLVMVKSTEVYASCLNMTLSDYASSMVVGHGCVALSMREKYQTAY